MKYLLCLIGLIGVLTFFHGKQNQETFPTSGEQKAVCFFESTGTPPLSAIENSGFGIGCFDIGHKNLSNKGLVPQSIQKKPVNFSPNPVIYRQNYPFIAKSTSLFLLYHFSQSLWRVILC